MEEQRTYIIFKKEQIFQENNFTIFVKIRNLSLELTEIDKEPDCKTLTLENTSKLV